MLETNIQTLATDHAQALTKRGLQVAATPGTPVADLVAYCKSSGVDDTVIATDDFNATVEGFADKTADFIRGYLDFARNTAKPALAAVQDAVNAALTKTDASAVFNPFAGMDIVQLGAPSILENSDFLQTVSHYNSGTDTVVNLAPRYGTRTNEQLIELCMTGNAAWDGAIKEWLASLGEGQLQTVWQSLFMDKAGNAPTAPIKGAEALLQDYTQGSFSALIIFLMASRVQNNIDDEFGHDLQAARNFLYSLLQASATHIERGINWYNSYVATGSLVSGLDRAARKIKVNASVYKQYLADGGKADVLMGMIVSGRVYNTIAEINAKAEELLSAWNQYALSTTSQSNAAFDTHLRSLMRQCFEDSLGNPVGDFETEQLAKPGTKETALSRFAELLERYSAEQLRENSQDALWRCACQARFYYNATIYDLLDAIDHGVRVDGRDPQDAATLAVQKIVPRFVGEMLTVSDAGAGETNHSPSAVALACAAKLSTEIVMRLSSNGVSGTIDGNYITRTTVASASLQTIVGMFK